MTGWRLWSVRVLLVVGGDPRRARPRRRARQPQRRSTARPSPATWTSFDATTPWRRRSAGRSSNQIVRSQPGPHRAAAVGRGGLDPGRGQRRVVGTGAPGRRGRPRRTDRAGRRLDRPADRRPRRRRRRGARRRRTGAGAGRRRMSRSRSSRSATSRSPSTTIALAHIVDVLAWLLPLAAVACAGRRRALSRDRWRAAMHAGWALVGAAVGVGVVLVVGGFLVASPRRRRRSAAPSGGPAWRVFVRPLWWAWSCWRWWGSPWCVTCGTVVPDVLRAQVRGCAPTLVRRPATAPGIAARAAVVGVLGLALVTDPAGTVELAAFVAGVGLVAVRHHRGRRPRAARPRPANRRRQRRALSRPDPGAPARQHSSGVPSRWPSSCSG